MSDAAAWSDEVHVTGCEVCRGRLGEVDPPGAADAPRERLWRGIEGVVTAVIVALRRERFDVESRG